MLSHPTHERLISLGLPGMAKAFEDQRRSPDIAALSFEERIGLMVDREAAERDSKRLSTRLKFAALRQNAVVEDVDLRTPRGIDRALFQRLVAGDWIDRAEGLLITGPTGVCKSWIACALGIGNPTRADATLDRLVHNAHRLPMTGESMRKLSAKKRVLDDAPKA
jgi:DNA replication protein DnaC